jgi:predicted nucleic acid-binding protein
LPEVLIDTTVWSLALRRPPHRLAPKESKIVAAMSRLVDQDQAVLLGCVRQELLCGFRDDAKYEGLRLLLRRWDDEPLSEVDYEIAASCCNACATRGIAGSATDFLICAVALRRMLPVFTTDPDFVRYASILSFDLYRIPADIERSA